MPSNTYGRQVVIVLTNRSGASVAAGDVVVIDTTGDDSFTTTVTGRAELSVGIAQETIASLAVGRVLTSGYASLINVPASVTRGHYIETHTVVKQATGSLTRRSGSFGQFGKTSATPSGWVWANADQTAAGGGSVATDVIWDAAGDLVQGTGADTAAKLTAGTAGMTLKSAGAAAANLWAFPPGYELDYVEFTTAVSVTATTEATSNTVVTGTSRTYDGGPVIVEFVCRGIALDSSLGSYVYLMLYDGATILGILASPSTPAASANNFPTNAYVRITPSAATHQYIIKALTNTGTASIKAGAGGTGTYMPGFIRVTKV